MYRLITFILFLALSVSAQHHAEPTPTNAPVDLGSIDFPNSGPAAAQKDFIEGVLLLHSFEYPRARRAFQAASKIAPDFALAYWGEAMTYDHPIWGDYDRESAKSVLSKLGATESERLAKAPSQREKMYLTAIERLFGEKDRDGNAADYSASMRDLMTAFPDDLEAQSFYSLSLLGLTGTKRNTENYMKAATVAEGVFKKNPRHPGALHYLIHAYDDPVHARLGLRAARLYGTVARGASHAQHMPSHIFFALGMWEDSIAANAASMKSARDAGSPGYHPLHWLMHSYLQLGRDDEAAKLLTVVEEDGKSNSLTYSPTAVAMCRATMLVETRGKGPASMMEPVAAASTNSPIVFANHDLAMGLEYLRRNDLASARRMLASIDGRIAAIGPRTATSAPTVQSNLDTLSIIQAVLSSNIDFASGDRPNAILRATEAAQAEDKLIFEYGPPTIVKPAWESAGEMLLAAGKKKEAANAFRSVLKRYPNRRLSNEGLKAAGRQKNRKESRMKYAFSAGGIFL